MKINILFLGLLFFGCKALLVVGSKYDSGGAIIEIVENDAQCRVEYEGYDLLLDEIGKKASNEMWSLDKIAEENASLPQGGRLIITISASTIGAANTKYWEYVVKSFDGKEIQRKEGRDAIPAYTVTRYGTTWWNINILNLESKLSLPIKLFVIDKLSTKRSAFTITPRK